MTLDKKPHNQQGTEGPSKAELLPDSLTDHDLTSEPSGTESPQHQDDLDDTEASHSNDKIRTNTVALKVHPHRLSLYEELHNRPSPVVDKACQIVHFTVILDDNREQLHQHLMELCQRYSVAVPGPESSCLYQDFGSFELRWERHLEFANFTFICHRNRPFDNQDMSFIPKDWLATIPGELVVAMNIAVINETIAESEVQRWFEGQRYAGSSVIDDKAQIWTAFRLHSDGFGRMLLHNKNLSGYQAGRLIQRLCELETYRLMSLLALPIARQLGSDLARIEQSLANLNHRIADIDSSDDERDLLQQLSSLAADVERHRSDTNFRFAASVAYHDLVNDRLEQLRETPLEGMQCFQEFLHRRLTPGIKTCNSVRDRLEDLSRRIHRTTSLLRTRVDLSIQEQNQDLLGSMNKRSALQLRLQQTVEGFSVVAISYYGLALLGLAFDAVEKVVPQWNSTLAIGITTPIVVLSVFAAVRRLRHKINDKKG